MESLENQVKILEEQLRQENEKTSSIEKEMKEMSEEMARLKEEVGIKKSETPEPTKKETTPRVKEKKKKTSDLQDSSENEGEAAKTATSDDSIVKEGILEKKGSIRHKWSKKYFVLDKTTNYLSYYDKKGVRISLKFINQQDKLPKGVIPLINATCYAHVEKKGAVKPLFFNIRTETNDFLIRASSAEEKAEWVKVIKQYCVPGVLTPDARKQLSKRTSSFIGRTVEQDKTQK